MLKYQGLYHEIGMGDLRVGMWLKFLSVCTKHTQNASKFSKKDNKRTTINKRIISHWGLLVIIVVSPFIFFRQFKDFGTFSQSWLRINLDDFWPNIESCRFRLSNTLTYRIPYRRQWIFVRSWCEAESAKLTWFDWVNNSTCDFA